MNVAITLILLVLFILMVIACAVNLRKRVRYGGSTLRRGVNRKQRHQAQKFSSPEEDVQFTMYRPAIVQPEVWTKFLVFTHIAKLSSKAPSGTPDPKQEVSRQAMQVLGAQVENYEILRQDSEERVPRSGDILLVPEAEHIDFNPRSRSFRWEENVHREEFSLRAPAVLDGQTVRGKLLIYVGAVIVARIPLILPIQRSSNENERPKIQEEKAERFQRIFVSYSHEDAAIVDHFEDVANALRNRFLRDVNDLRVGEIWNQRLEEMIREADVFQLFWSTNSMRSEFVEREWRFALALDRPDFVLPVYWEIPFPKDPKRNLPPDELSRLHFHRLGSFAKKSSPSVSGIALIGVLLIMCSGLVYRHTTAGRLAKLDEQTIALYESKVIDTERKVAEQLAVNTVLERDLYAQTKKLTEVSNTLGTVMGNLAKVREEAQIAAINAGADLAKRDARINELETQRGDLTKRMTDLNGEISDYQGRIDDVQSKLVASEGDRDYLVPELKRLQSEKNDLERQFNDVAMLREQVGKLKDELSIASRLDWIRRGLYGSLKGAGRLPPGLDQPRATNRPNYDLNVELKESGGVQIGPKPTNATAPRPTDSVPDPK